MFLFYQYLSNILIFNLSCLIRCVKLFYIQRLKSFYSCLTSILVAFSQPYFTRIIQGKAMLSPVLTRIKAGHSSNKTTSSPGTVQIALMIHFPLTQTISHGYFTSQVSAKWIYGAFFHGSWVGRSNLFSTHRTPYVTAAASQLANNTFKIYFNNVCLLENVFCTNTFVCLLQLLTKDYLSKQSQGVKIIHIRWGCKYSFAIHKQ